MFRRCRFRVSAPHLLRATLVVVLLLGASPATTAAQNELPAVDITLVVRVRDVGSWLALQNEVLGRVPDVRIPLWAALSAGTGGRRTLTLFYPTFATEMVLTGGAPSVKIGVTGKVAAAEALRGLGPFQHAASEIQSGLVENRLTLAYGLFSVDAQLIEIHISR